MSQIDKYIGLAQRLRQVKTVPDYGRRNSLLEYIEDIKMHDSKLVNEVKAIPGEKNFLLQAARLVGHFVLTTRSLNRINRDKLAIPISDEMKAKEAQIDPLWQYAGFSGDWSAQRQLYIEFHSYTVELERYVTRMIGQYNDYAGIGLQYLMGDDGFTTTPYDAVINVFNASLSNELDNVALEAYNQSRHLSMDHQAITVAHTVVRYTIANESKISISPDIVPDNFILFPENLLKLEEIGPVVPIQAGYYLLALCDILPARLHNRFWSVVNVVAPRTGLNMLFAGEVADEHFPFPLPAVVVNLIQQYDTFRLRETVIQRLLALPDPLISLQNKATTKGRKPEIASLRPAKRQRR